MCSAHTAFGTGFTVLLYSHQESPVFLSLAKTEKGLSERNRPFRSDVAAPNRILSLKQLLSVCLGNAGKDNNSSSSIMSLSGILSSCTINGSYGSGNNCTASGEVTI